MKKLILVIVIVMSVFSSNAQAYNQGDAIISLGYGVPSLLSFRFGVVDVNENRNISTLGPVYLKFEYLASKVVSVGVQVAYAKADVDYSIDYIDLNNQVQRGSEGCTLTNLGIYTDLNFYWLRTGKLAMYSGVGMGYNYFDYSEYSDDPYFNTSNLDFGLGETIPVGGQLTAIGAKVNFSNGLGAYTSFGIGKSLFEVGICYGFNAGGVDEK